MQRIISRSVLVAIVASFFVPLLVLPMQFIFPFIVPKILLFRSLSVLLLCGYVLLVFIDKERYLPKNSLMHWSVLFLSVSYIISTFVGVDWYRSFWDNHERMLGLFTIMHYIFYYFVLAQVVDGWNTWKWLLRFFLMFGGLVMFIGFLQKYVNPQLMLNRGATRVSSTLGNAIYFSAYGMFLFFVGMLLVLKEEVRGWKLCAGSIAVLGFLGIFLGGTRGTLLGVVGGLGVLTLLYIYTLKDTPSLARFRYIAMGGMVVLCMLFGVIFAYRDTTFVKNIPAVGRLVQVDFSKGSAGTRIMAWQVAIEAWKEKPLFGWGPNNFYYAFNTFYRPEFLRHGWGETWFDNAHSVPMNTLATRGLIGMFSYLGLFVAASVSLKRAYRKKHIDMHIHNVSIAFLIGHFIHNIFVFENPTSYLYFFFFLAFISSMTKETGDIRQKAKDISGVFIGGVVVVTGILILVTNVNPGRANIRTLLAVRAFHEGRQAIETYEYAQQTPSPHIDDIRNDVARTIREVIPAYVQAGKGDLAHTYLTLAYDELQKNMVLHPMDIRVHLQRAGIAQILAEVTQDPRYILDAERMLEDALLLSPKRQQLQFQLATIKMQVAKPQEAVTLYENALVNDPTISETWWRYAALLDGYGNHDAALDVIRRAETQGIVFVKDGKKVVDALKNSESN